MSVTPGRSSFAKNNRLGQQERRNAFGPSRLIASRLKSFLHACVPSVPFHTQPIAGICRVDSPSHNPDTTKPGAYDPSYFSYSGTCYAICISNIETSLGKTDQHSREYQILKKQTQGNRLGPGRALFTVLYSGNANRD